jgi:hypothetical protein
MRAQLWHNGPALLSGRRLHSRYCLLARKNTAVRRKGGTREQYLQRFVFARLQDVGMESNTMTRDFVDTPPGRRKPKESNFQVIESFVG